MVDKTLLVERTRLRDELAALEVRLSFRRWGMGSGSGWAFHAPRERPSVACIEAYVHAVHRLLPELGWSADDVEQRRCILAVLHDAYANVDLDRIEQIRAWAADRPSEAATPARVRNHIAWLALRIEEVRQELRAA